MIKQIFCETREELFTKVANKCASRLTRGVEKQGRASFVVPGGTTPAPMFSKLSQMSLDWHNILVAPSDERWLDTSHAQSNQRLIEESLLINNATKARLMPLKTDAETPALGEAVAEQNISELEQPFDVCLVGMGNDGHFASLFPGTPQLAEALDPENPKKCIGIDATGCPVAGENTQRMSLTLSAILNSKLIILLITGEEKLKVVKQAMDTLAPFDQPISALFHQNQTPIEIYWAE